jgi:hypothetical protein
MPRLFFFPAFTAYRTRLLTDLFALVQRSLSLSPRQPTHHISPSLLQLYPQQSAESPAIEAAESQSPSASHSYDTSSRSEVDQFEGGEQIVSIALPKLLYSPSLSPDIWGSFSSASSSSGYARPYYFRPIRSWLISSAFIIHHCCVILALCVWCGHSDSDAVTRYGLVLVFGGYSDSESSASTPPPQDDLDVYWNLKMMANPRRYINPNIYDAETDPDLGWPTEWVPYNPSIPYLTNIIRFL